MKKMLLVVLLGILLVGCGGDDAEDSAGGGSGKPDPLNVIQELEKWEGKWVSQSSVAGGEKMDESRAPGMPHFMSCQNGVITFSDKSQKTTRMQNLEPRFSAIGDRLLVELVDPERGFLLPCLYEWNNDILKLAMPMVPAERKPGEILSFPASFDSTGKPIIVFEFKKVK